MKVQYKYQSTFFRVCCLTALYITGTLRRSRRAALDTILNLPSIVLRLEDLAVTSAIGLEGRGFVCDKDYMNPRLNWERGFQTIIEEK